MFFLRLFFSVFFALFIALTGTAQPAGEVAAASPPYQLGDEVQPFALKDVAGKLHDLGEMLGENIIVVYFWNFHCPVSRVYEERLQNLYQAYQPRNVIFWVVDSNAANSETDILAYHKQHALAYPVLKDYGNMLADQFNASKTPEAFVIGQDKRLHYFGAIDNNHNPDKADQHYVINALESLLQNKAPAVPHFPAFGCAIKRE
ncbi:MAG: redoxin domain-containing protein [Candidatus Hinthialibacter antarcticus]|nr:redoxin domain-containing protein [Candidatus Hinthialibacter antarcticus]